jgi:hypothetical protein
VVGHFFVSSIFLDEFLEPGMIGESIFKTLRVEFSEPDGRRYRGCRETSTLGRQLFLELLKRFVIGASLVKECAQSAPTFRHQLPFVC